MKWLRTMTPNEVVNVDHVERLAIEFRPGAAREGVEVPPFVCVMVAHLLSYHAVDVAAHLDYADACASFAATVDRLSMYDAAGLTYAPDTDPAAREALREYDETPF